MNGNPHKLLISADTVPSLPTVFHRLNEAVNNPRSTMRDIARIIRSDQALSARLLRIANSAFYSFPSKIGTISRAVTIIGTRQLRDLALATTVVNLFKDLPPDLVNMKSFWRHSLLCGFAARVLASYYREANIERLFVGGLMHDIGRLLIYKKIPAKGKEALLQARKTGDLLYNVERSILGFDHAEVGGLLLNAWKLPPNLEEAVKHHHRPTRASRYPVEAATVHVADQIAVALNLGSSGERFVPPLERKAWEHLDLSISVLLPAIEETERQYSGAIDLFLEGA